MATEDNSIYLVNFENYLRPKVGSKKVQNLPDTQPEDDPKPIEPSEQTSPNEDVQEKSSFDMFCECSSIHGLSMLVITKQATIYERVAWQIIIVIAIIASALTLLKSWQINAGTPTVTYIENTHYPAYTVPFPAVTLCSLNRISKKKAFKLAKRLVETTGLNKSDILRLFEVPFYVTENIHATEADYHTFETVLSNNNMSLLKFFMEVSPDCVEELVRCMWKGRTAPCDSLFEPIIVPRGRCCSFNYYARPVNRSLRNVQSLTPSVPRHVSGSGYETGLTVLINPHSDDYLAGFLAAPGYRVIVHDAYDFPEDNSDNEFMLIETEGYIAVKPEVTYGTKYLRNMGFERRSCTFDPEHNLHYFTQYSFWNCLAECLSFRVLKKCKCIPHHLASFPDREMCNMTQFDCVTQETDIFQDLVETRGVLGSKICGCMPECSFNKYKTIVSRDPINRTFTKGKHRFFKNVTIDDKILLHVFFADLSMPLNRKDALDSWQSIVGTVGGITGITMGFSVVSISEAFFFLCVRPVYMKCVKYFTRVKAN